MNTPNITIYILFFVALITADSNAQLLDTNTIWSEREYKYTYELDDTVSMNNKVYHRINRYSDTTISYNINSNVTFLIRTVGDSVFRYDQFMDEDVLIYDFSMESSDSIYVYPYSDMVNDSVLLRCENVDTVNVMGIQRRRLTMRTLDPDPYYQSDLENWYWGIGSDLGLLKVGHQGVPMTLDSYAPLLYCCHKGFDQIYQTNLYPDCHNTASLQENSQLQISLFPNPISKGQTLTIELDNKQIDEVRIFSLHGKQVYVSSFSGNNEIIIHRGFEPGLYFVLFYDGSNILHREKIVVK